MQAAIVQSPPVCSEHPTQRVVALCQWCRRPLCPLCARDEDGGGAVLCGACAVQDIDARMAAERESGRAKLARLATKPLRLRRLRLGAGAIVIALQLGWIAEDPGEVVGAALPARVAPWTIGAAAPEQGQGEECARRLFAARLAVDRASVGRSAPLAQLPAAPEGSPPHRCPASDRAFAYRPAGRHGALACPEPGKHGVRAITADAPGQPPLVTPR